MQLPHLPFVVLDTETTGFVPKVNRIIEYAHVRYEDNTETDRYETLCSIPTEVPAVVQVITRITDDALQGKPSFEEKREEILKRIGDDTIIVGQNIQFDIGMLKGEGIDLSDRPQIDTSMLASLVFPEFESYSLGYISAILDLNHEPVHRALGDVQATLELLSACWERLLELPQTMVDDLKATMAKSSSGYTMLFDALPASNAVERPKWMTVKKQYELQHTQYDIQLLKPQIGNVDMIEEPLDAGFLQGILDAASDNTTCTHIIAVKNVTAALKRLRLNEHVRVLQPPFLLLDPDAANALADQQSYNADEATLLTKLQWYTPHVYNDAPIHGGEKSIWNGRLTCTEQSPLYQQQFTDLPSVILLDHRQLLHFIHHPDDAFGMLHPENHIIIDDASMLEDTANKAYGAYCNLGDLRAASNGHEALTKCTDLLQLWIERVRNEQDTRILTPNDFDNPDIISLREQFESQRKDVSHSPQTLRLLDAICQCIEPDAVKRITWIETRQDGIQHLHSVPESVAELLQEELFSRFPTTLLIPPKSADIMQETVHRSVKRSLNPVVSRTQKAMELSFPEGLRGKKVVSDPPDGKTVVLVNSRRVIEEYFVQCTEDLEAQGITLICQGFSGGQKRMQAEFIAADSPAVWVLTPWSFEGVELPPNTVDHLIVDALPFDHPSHPVFGARAEHFDNAFLGYSLPRLLHRLFRILRTFRRISTDAADVTVIDSRITEKAYGKNIKAYLHICCEQLSGSSKVELPHRGGSSEDYPENWQMNLF